MGDPQLVTGCAKADVLARNLISQAEQRTLRQGQSRGVSRAGHGHDCLILRDGHIHGGRAGYPLRLVRTQHAVLDRQTDQ